MSIYDAIAEGKYESKIKLLPTPKEPPILKKTASQLLADDIASLPKVKADYEQACRDYQQRLTDYRQDEGQLRDTFFGDLFAEYDVVPGDEFAQKMSYLAWQQGHSAGYHDVVGAFADLMELWDIYAKVKYPKTPQ